MHRVCVFLLSLALVASAQTARTIQATGTATLMVNPDQASLDVGVTTTAATAQDSAAQNAAQTTGVLSSVKAVLNGAGTVQTQNYSVSPRYTTNGSTSTINGYVTSNTLRVVTTDLSLLGRLIDAANAAGANTVGNLAFGLQDPDPNVQQALANATKQAMAHANAIAGGLGGKAGPVVSAMEGSSYSPILIGGYSGNGAAATITPVQTGTVSVYANVTLIVQLQ
ncbi:MAG TPA: SIMPL domain-containing protein [Candidatus Acidoferrum sp.]|jgi:uncharacterized protein YggE|nr:SIMPL domain-containing protein [Candidatus Acidoferrum sp.]